MVAAMRRILLWFKTPAQPKRSGGRRTHHGSQRLHKARRGGAHKRRSRHPAKLQGKRSHGRTRLSSRSGRDSSRDGKRGTVVAYHGTPSTENARSILRDGWMVGSGNVLGDGVYLAKDLATAKSYAGSNGVYLRCLVRLGRSCRWDSATQTRFNTWCRARAVQVDHSAKTAYLLRRGFDTVQSGNVIVVLAPQYANPTAWKRRNHRVRILGVHRASDDRRIRV